MNNIAQEILRLTEFWYKYVGMDDHKDRDCRFTITETWEYGHFPKYEVEHYGYIAGEHRVEAKDLEEATEKLYEMLVEIIKEKQDFAKGKLENPDDWNEIQIKQAKRILKFKI